MIKFIKQIIIYFLVTIVGWLAFVFLVANSFESLQSYFEDYSNIPANAGKPGDSSAIRFTDINNYSDIDILFIGSSHFYRGIDIRVIEAKGYKVFNMGSTSQSTLNSYFLLSEHIDRLNPKLVVIESYGRILSSDGLESFYDLTLNVPQLDNLFEMALATENFKAVNNYLTSKFSLKERSNEIKIAHNNTYVSGGFVEAKLKPYKDNWILDTFFVETSPIQVDYMKRIVALVESRNIKVVMLELPVAKILQDATVNIDELRALLAQIATTNNIQFINLNEFVQLEDRKHFYDEDHLNQTGAEVVSDRIIDVLKNHDLLK